MRYRHINTYRRREKQPPQLWVYDQCLQRWGAKHAWIGFLDADEFLVLRFKAWNEPPFQFEWVDGKHTLMDYGAILTRILRKYDARF